MPAVLLGAASANATAPLLGGRSLESLEGHRRQLYELYYIIGKYLAGHKNCDDGRDGRVARPRQQHRPGGAHDDDAACAGAAHSRDQLVLVDTASYLPQPERGAVLLTKVSARFNLTYTISVVRLHDHRPSTWCADAAHGPIAQLC